MNALYMLMLHKNATYCLKVRTEDVVGFGSYWMVLPTTQGFGLKRPKWGRRVVAVREKDHLVAPSDSNSHPQILSLHHPLS
jgi:hypothetical protein